MNSPAAHHRQPSPGRSPQRRRPLRPSAIALGILAASEQIPSTALADYEFLGELALSGELRPVRGAIAAAMAADKAHRQLILAEDNGPEVSLTGQKVNF